MKVSRICLGCMGFGDPQRWVHKWVLDEENSRPIIKKALEMGINFFDTANIYSVGTSEEIVGRALKDFAKREEVIIATKLHGKMREDPNGGGLSERQPGEQSHGRLRLSVQHDADGPDQTLFLCRERDDRQPLSAHAGQSRLSDT